MRISGGFLKGTMTTKKITINGKEYPVVFTMKTILTFEENTNKSFFGEQFETLRNRMAIIYSAVVAADQETSFTLDDMMNIDNMQGMKDVLEAFTLVMEMASEFFKVPEIEPKDTSEPDDNKGTKTKN